MHDIIFGLVLLFHSEIFFGTYRQVLVPCQPRSGQELSEATVGQGTGRFGQFLECRVQIQVPVSMQNFTRAAALFVKKLATEFI